MQADQANIFSAEIYINLLLISKIFERIPHVRKIRTDSVIKFYFQKLIFSKSTDSNHQLNINP